MPRAPAASRAALAGVVAAAFTTLLVVTDSVSGPGGSQSELLAPDAVTAARLQLAQAEQGDNLAKLDAAIAQGESVLKTIGVGAHARTQSLAQVRPADVDTWLEKAEAAGAKVEGFEAMRSRTRSEAARIKRAEEDWMKQAKEAKERAQQLAAHSSSSVESLEDEKRALRAQLDANEAKIRRVEALEGAASPPEVTESSTVRSLELELQRQIREYQEAKKEKAISVHAQERAKEEQLVDEIHHFKNARKALLRSSSLRAWGRGRGRGRYRGFSSGSLDDMQLDRARLQVKRRRIQHEIARIDDEHVAAQGHAARGGHAAGSAAAKVKHMSVLQGFEKALGDEPESAKAALASTPTAALAAHSAGNKLPGVNADRCAEK